MALTKIPSELSSTTGIVDNSNATAITIDSNENVGIGTSSPSNYYSTTLVVDAPDEDGITVVSPTTGSGYLMFADGTSGNARYRGYIAYAHAVDEMQFATSGLTRMRIDASGRVTMPSQPSFKVQTNYASNTAIVSVSPDWSLAAHNVGNHFNLSTNTFTAPVNGSYFFSVHSLISLVGASSYAVLELMKNGVRMGLVHSPFGDISNYIDLSLTEVIYCNTNDAITIRAFTNGNNAANAWYQTTHYNSFSGYLLG